MTHSRKPASIDQTVFDTIGVLSPIDIEEHTGKSQAAFYNIANPSIKTQLLFKDAAALERARIMAGKPGVFGDLFSQLASVEDTNVMLDLDNGMRSAMGLFGRLMEEYSDALEDGVLEPHERRALADRAEKLRVSATALRDALLDDAT